MIDEIWKDIPGYEGCYVISESGDIQNIKTGRIRKGGEISGGYLSIDLWKNGTQKENMQQCVIDGRISKCISNHFRGKLGKDNSKSKKVNQYTKEGVFIKSFGSIQEAMRETGIIYQTISRCCIGEMKSAGGFVWKYS